MVDAPPPPILAHPDSGSAGPFVHQTDRMHRTPTPPESPAVPSRFPRLLRPVVIAACALAVLAASCSSSESGESTAVTDETTTTLPASVPPAPGGPDDPAFAQPGPFAVGVTSLSLPDRQVEVWYPATAVPAGTPVATYSQLDALPDNLAALAPGLLPAGTSPDILTVTMADTFRDVPASTDGPFPLVLFSHGFGSFRLDASALLRGIASWGFVVAAPDHIERGRAALVTGQVTRAPERDVEVLLDTIDLVGSAGGVLAGLTDTERVGAVGHSAGGRAVLTALSEPQVDVAVGWAAAGRADIPAPEKPSMNIAALVDVLVPVEEVRATYAGMAPPKRLVVIDGAGHNSFTDVCLAVRSGSDLIGLAQSIGFDLPEGLAAGAVDGCQPEAIDTQVGWAITQSFTVAELRAGLGLDESGAGLGPGVVEAWDVPVEYTEDLVVTATTGAPESTGAPQTTGAGG